MKNAPGANNVGLHGHVVRGLFLLTETPWIGDETYREYAEVSREYLEISIKGVNFLKSKRQLLNTMGTSYDEYLRNSRRLIGLELDLICERVTEPRLKPLSMKFMTVSKVG